MYLARLGLPAGSLKQNFPEKHIITNPLLTKLVRSRWLDIGLILFLHVYGPRLSSHLDLTLGQKPIFMGNTALITDHTVM